MDKSLTHEELCRKTAEWALKRNDVCLWEFRTLVGTENPDVLAFRKEASTLYEIKMSRPDFLADGKKSSRRNLRDKKARVRRIPDIKYKAHMRPSRTIRRNGNTEWEYRYHPVKFVRQDPHLGLNRYYVCPHDLIQPEEVEHFGLYWFKNGRFYKKKDSEVFRRDLYLENRLLVHAMKLVQVGDDKRVMVQDFKGVKPEYSG